MHFFQKFFVEKYIHLKAKVYGLKIGKEKYSCNIKEKTSAAHCSYRAPCNQKIISLKNSAVFSFDKMLEWWT